MRGRPKKMAKTHRVSMYIDDDMMERISKLQQMYDDEPFCPPDISMNTFMIMLTDLGCKSLLSELEKLKGKG
jgi:hypothetical protein